MVGLDRAAEARARALQREAVETALGLVERAIDARQLFFGDHVRRQATLDLAEPFVVGFAEGRESAVQILEGGGLRSVGLVFEIVH